MGSAAADGSADDANKGLRRRKLRKRKFAFATPLGKV